ncbi:hypothetical protein Psch_02709 [Pelotomaculum schinkii]|uniref:Sporadically distributed protein, TIGR04141 family n=1 Tax=Pelotomaculum schinkii TaxID=78350 RepID=A0A4Y7R9N5_9FIRM|nr:DUF6119 family protein [Pelotomaculum schinkii]TEB05668.1 hypothetical protein Psch_02709 [Pelotomaculum schinkii]
MSSTNTPEAQFSIYQIDYERVSEIMPIVRKQGKKGYYEEIKAAIINSTLKILQEKRNAEYKKVKYLGFEGVIFKTIHNPAWQDVVVQILSNNELSENEKDESRKFLLNVNVSYILLYQNGKILYGMTGGYGSKYISKFVNRNFGLYLIPKIIEQDNPVLKQIIQNNLTGNQLSIQRANRQTTNFLVEQDMSSIYRQLNIEVDRKIAQEFGIKFDEDESERKKINIVNKDSLVIRRCFTLSQLIIVLKKIDKLTKAEDNFALNYLVLAKKKNYKNSELLEILKKIFKEKNYGAFVLVGDEFEDYILNASKYIVKDAKGNVFIESTQPIKINDIYDKFETNGIRLSMAFIYEFLKKWTISTEDESGILALPATHIFDAIQGFVEVRDTKDPVYLFNGEWYVFDTQYTTALNNEYGSIFENHLNNFGIISNKFSLLHKAATETEYNKILESQKNILVAHTVLMNNVEIADAIFWDDSTVYLMHNKGKFDGEGVRDVINQILTSAEYMQKILQGISKDEWLKKYYKGIVAKRPIIVHKISAEEFTYVMTNKNICYIAGYLSGFRKKTTATYAKYLTIEAEKRLSAKGYGFISMNVTR